MLDSIFESATKEGFGGWKMERTQAEVAKGDGGYQATHATTTASAILELERDINKILTGLISN